MPEAVVTPPAQPAGPTVPAVPDGYDVIGLPAPPALALSYLRAIAPGRRRPPDAGLPPTVLRLAVVVPDAGHVARYARIVGAPAGPDLPLLYPSVAAFGLQLALITAPAFPFPAMGTVHLAHRVARTRALPAGDDYDLQVWAERLRPHRRGRTFDVVSVLRHGGEPVWTQTGTFLSRGPRPDDAPGRTPEPADPPTADAPDLEDLTSWQLSGGLGRGFAAVSGDRNPIHLHAVTARPFGFRRPIAHGMWTAARLLHAVDGGLPVAQQCSVRFRAPVPLPSAVDVLRTPVGPGPGPVRAQVRRADVAGTLCVDLRLAAL